MFIIQKFMNLSNFNQGKIILTFLLIFDIFFLLIPLIKENKKGNLKGKSFFEIIELLVELNNNKYILQISLILGLPFLVIYLVG